MRNLVTFSHLGKGGRFANGCYQIAGTIGIARMNGFDFGFPYWMNHNGRDFEPDLDIDCQKEFVNPLPRYDGPDLPEWGVTFGWHPDSTRLPHSVDLRGQLQSEKYFQHCIHEIRWYFRMKDEPPLNDYVAVHVRLGDYGDQPSPQHPTANPFHPRMNLSYYVPAMALFAGRKFLVFSDGIEECKRMFGNSVDYSEGRSYFGDFKLMKRCHSFVVANSSFSMFAAILADQPGKEIVAPSPWFGRAFNGTLPEQDIYPEGSRIVNWETREISFVTTCASLTHI
jgi:hypothetical protein